MRKCIPQGILAGLWAVLFIGFAAVDGRAQGDGDGDGDGDAKCYLCDADDQCLWKESGPGSSKGCHYLWICPSGNCTGEETEENGYELACLPKDGMDCKFANAVGMSGQIVWNPANGGGGEIAVWDEADGVFRRFCDGSILIQVATDAARLPQPSSSDRPRRLII